MVYVPKVVDVDVPDAVRESTDDRVKTRIVVADDHPAVRNSMTKILSLQPDFEVVGQATDGEEAVDLTRRLMPDIVLMDVTMPGMSGIDATRIILAVSPSVRVIGLSMHVDPNIAAQMRDAGAVAYLAKDDPMKSVIEVIRKSSVR